VANKHQGHPDTLFPECAHDDDIEPRKWIKIGTKAYDKLNWMLTKTTLLNDLKNYPQKTKQAVWKGSMPHDPHFVGTYLLAFISMKI